MKKITAIILEILFLGMFSMYAMAADYQFDYKTMSNSDKISIMDNKSAILSDINAVLEAEKIEDKMTVLPLDDFVKIYIDTDLFALDSADYDTMKSAFGNDQYVYTCTAYVKNAKVEYTLGKVDDIDENEKESMTDEELLEFEKNIGKWCVSSVSVIHDDEECYTELVNQLAFEDYDNVLIVGSLKGFRYPVAIGFKNGQASDIITILKNSSAYDILEHIPATMSVDDKKNVYDYTKVAKFAEDAYTPVDDVSGGESLSGDSQMEKKNIFIIAIGSVGILVGVLAILRYMKEKDIH